MIVEWIALKSSVCMPIGYEDSEDYGGRQPGFRNDLPLIVMLLVIGAVGYWAVQPDPKRICRELREDEIETFMRDGKRMLRLDQLQADECVVIRPPLQSKPKS